MKKLTFIALLLCAFAFTAQAANMSWSEISIPALQKIVSSRFGTQIDSDGDLKISADGSNFYVTIQKDKKLIRFVGWITKPANKTRAQMMEIANKFNNDTVFLRAAVDSDSDLACTYYIVADGGLDSTNFMEAVLWYSRCLKSLKGKL